MVLHSKAIPEGGDSEIGYQDLSGFDEIDQKAEKAEPKSTVVWKRLAPSQAACAPARRSFHTLVVAPSTGRGPKEQTILLVGGETEPKYRGRQMQPLVLCAPAHNTDSAVASPAIGRRDSMRPPSIGGPGSEALGGFSREISQTELSPWSPRASIARSIRSPGPFGFDGDRAASPPPIAAQPVPDFDRWEWRPNKAELTQRLRGCTVTAVGQFILVFGGLRLDTLSPSKVPVGEALYQSSQVSGELHVFDAQQGKWRHLKGEGAGKTQVEYEQVQAAAPANPTRRASTSNTAQAAAQLPGKRPSIINMAPIPVATPEPTEDIQADGEPPRSRFEHAACAIETKGNWLLVHGGRSAKHAYPIESSFVLQVRGRQFKWARLHPGRVTHGQGEKLQDHGQMLQSQARRKQFTRRGHTLCAVPHRPRHLVMFGGRMDSGEEGRICSELMIIEVDAENATYMIMPHQSIGQPPAARIYHSACTLGHFLAVFGGISRKGEPLNDLHLLHMGPMIWSRMRSPIDAEALNIVWPTPRWGHSAVTVERPEGRGGVAMLVFGGMAPGNQQLDECLCLCFETPMSNSGDGGGPGTEVFGIYPEGILVSMWDRLFANLASLEHEQMLKVSKQSEESEVMSSRLQDFENQLASMEAQAGMAERTVAAIDKTIQAAHQRLEQAKAQTAEEQAEVAAQIAASELQVEALRRKLERLEITQDILEKGRLISPADLVLHPADMGAVVSFGKRTDVAPPTPLAKGAAVPTLVPASEAVLTRSGFWCGTPVTLEEIALPSAAESTDEQVRKAPSAQRPATQRGAWEAAARRELRLAVKLRHPNLVEYYGGSLDGDRLLLVAEPPLVPLMLELRVRHHPRLAPGKGKGRLAVSLDVALALEYLHCRGIAHRRVGIERVFLRDAPRLVAKLGGLLPARILWRAQKEWLMVSQARRLPAQRHRVGVKPTRNSVGPGDGNGGHEAAMPAILAGQLPSPADPRAVDMFALGVLILQLFGNDEGDEGQRTLNRSGSKLKGSGRLDESWPQSPHQSDKPVASAAVGRIRDRTVRLVVMRCMEKDPRHRMSASAAARALENALSGDGLVADAPEVDLSNRFPLVDADLEALAGAEDLE